jgi:hypothetical protein
VALFHTSSPESAEEDLAKAIHVKADQGGDIDGWLQDALDAKSSRTFTFHFASLSWAAILTPFVSGAVRAEASKDGRFHVAL